MEQTTIFLTLLGMMAVTALPRILPLLLLSLKPLPKWAMAWLRYVPVAILSAMLLPSLLIMEGKLSFSKENLFLLAAFPTILMAWKTRSFLGAVAVGMGVVALLRLWA